MNLSVTEHRETRCAKKADPPDAVPAFTYVLPIKSAVPVDDPEFVAYLRWVSERADLIVVDGSSPEVFERHRAAWAATGRHLAPERVTPVGKVGGVLTGVRAAMHDRIVIADDDVRYGDEIADLVRMLDEAELVRPQNHFDPLPWYAAWDTARMLVNRAWGGDWPGTFAVRGSALLAAGGYAGDALFENLELAATIEAAGARHLSAPGLFVRRLPATPSHFWSQRVRQAYEELARPARFAAFVPLAPLGSAAVLSRRWRTLFVGVGIVALAAVGTAEAGRRRDGGRSRFPVRCSLLAPVWVAERAVCVWAALVLRARGGLRYGTVRVRRAGSGRSERRQRVEAAMDGSGYSWAPNG